MEDLGQDRLDNIKTNTSEKSFRAKAALFLAGVSGLSAIIGFSTTVAAVKKRNPNTFDQGVAAHAVKGMDSGAQLALRALGYGTVLAFTGCGVLFYGIWKLSGASSLSDFRQKAGSILPRLTPIEHKSKTEFSGLNELLSYISRER
ncbi:transmembrane protein 242 [Ctenocephalides felis]|uniref:transmembrane protein 242 n=1 Tax=Ctenocephalides felis TaxID=7515 RepID=UPI000E6E535D|nr:transmembrane protein 242 [Ctenocephalides felis]